MNAVEAEDVDSWSQRRWLAVIGLVLLVHIGFIFWLGEHGPVKLIPPATGAAMYFPADQTAALPGVSDPTLFMLPNRHGFSGAAWLTVPSFENHLAEWTGPEPSPAPAPELGRTLNEFVQTSLSRPFEVAGKPEPQLDTLEYPPPPSLLAAQSTYTIEGALARRRLLSTLKLDSQPSGRILTNSEVLVAVNPGGSVFSAVLLTRCGPKDDLGAVAADKIALDLARSARFQPLRWHGPIPPANSPAALTWGRLVFHWHTSVPPDNNTAAKNP